MNESPSRKRVLLIDNYDSFTWNLVHLLGAAGVDCDVVRNDVLGVDDAAARARGCGGLVISPGPGNPSDAGITLALLERLNGSLPVFGVCLGHQAIGQFFGGRVVRAPRRMHGRTSSISHTAVGVFSGLPERITVTRYHSLIVERDTLPDCLEVTAWTDDGDIMGVRHRSLPIEGVQFHPESFLSEHGLAMAAAFATRVCAA